MSPTPEPHRISLARGWNYSKDWQRFFHKPTNLCPQSVVRLRIETDRPLNQVRLNGQILQMPQGSSQSSAIESGTENSTRFGYDWSIGPMLQARNELVLSQPNPQANPDPNPDPKTQESQPQIEVWLEIFVP